MRVDGGSDGPRNQWYSSQAFDILQRNSLGASTSKNTSSQMHIRRFFCPTFSVPQSCVVVFTFGWYFCSFVCLSVCLSCLFLAHMYKSNHTYARHIHDTHLSRLCNNSLTHNHQLSCLRCCESCFNGQVGRQIFEGKLGVSR